MHEWDRAIKAWSKEPWLPDFPVPEGKFDIKRFLVEDKTLFLEEHRVKRLEVWHAYKGPAYQNFDDRKAGVLQDFFGDSTDIQKQAELGLAIDRYFGVPKDGEDEIKREFLTKTYQRKFEGIDAIITLTSETEGLTVNLDSSLDEGATSPSFKWDPYAANGYKRMSSSQLILRWNQPGSKSLFTVSTELYNGYRYPGKPPVPVSKTHLIGDVENNSLTLHLANGSEPIVVKYL